MNIYSYYHAKFKENPSVGTDESTPLRKTTIYYTNIDLVNDNMYKKFGINRSIGFKDIEQKLNYEVNQGPSLCCKFELIQAFTYVFDTCKNGEDPIKNEGARVFTIFLPLYTMGFF